MDLRKRDRKIKRAFVVGRTMMWSKIRRGNVIWYFKQLTNPYHLDHITCEVGVGTMETYGETWSYVKAGKHL